ncbi:YfhO family protein, partial [bacterium]|nr:YfhO family protein [bacterium]
MKNPLLSDPVTIFYPFTIPTYEYLKDFKIPLWNPYLLCGIPHNISFPVPFPIFLSLGLISSLPAAYSFIIILQVFLAGFFMFLYLKNLGVASFGSLVGAIVFMLNGVFAVWLEFTTTVGAGLWFPLIFLLIDKTISKKSLFYSGLTALFIGIHFFSSHLQFATYLLISAFVYALFRTLWLYRKERSFNSILKSMGLIILSFGLGISLSSAYILPTFDKASFSHRQEVTFKELNPLPMANLVTFVIPDFYGTPAPPHSYRIVRNWFYQTGLIKKQVVKVGGENYNEYCGYIGVLPLILALLAGLLRKDRDSRFFFGFWIVSLLLALGTFLYLPLYWFAPGFNKMGISRIIFLFCFSGSILAGMGAEQLTEHGARSTEHGREELVVRIVVWVLVIATLGWIIFLLIPKFNPQLELLAWHFSLKNPSMTIPILLVLSSIIILLFSIKIRNPHSAFRNRLLKGAILLVVSFDLLYFGMKYNPMTPKEWL